VGWSDEQLLRIPYARLLQEKRVIDETIAARQKEEWRQQAFVGWQVASALGGKVGPFDKYLRKLGLHDRARLTPEQVQREKDKAFAAAALVEARFDRGRNP